MGHVLFILLHLAALLFFIPGLFVTLPVHIVYAFMAKKGSGATPAPAGFTWPCPFCKETIQRGSTVCRWCRMPVSDDDRVNEALKERLARGETVARVSET